MNDEVTTPFKRLCHIRSVQKAALQCKRPLKPSTIGFPAAVASLKLILICLAEVSLPDQDKRQTRKSLPWKSIFLLKVTKLSLAVKMCHHNVVSPQRERRGVVCIPRHVLEKQHGVLGEAEMSLHLKQDFTHNPEDGGIKKVITCVSIEIPA